MLNNWRRHRDDDGTYTLLGGRLDPYASGLVFRGWREQIPKDAPLPRDYEAPPVSEPATWLLDRGLLKASPIGMTEVPGPRKIAAVDR